MCGRGDLGVVEAAARHHHSAAARHLAENEYVRQRDCVLKNPEIE